MRSVCSVLAAFVVSGSLISASLADEKADVARVEQEIQAVDEAIAIHDRAKERAQRAVHRSSLGKQYRAAKAEATKARKEFEASRAYQQHLGKHKLKRPQPFARSIGAGGDPQSELSALQDYLDETDRRRKEYEKASKIPELLSRKANVYAEKMAIYIRRMTRIFLDDEILRAEQKKLDGLRRELKKIKERDYAEA